MKSLFSRGIRPARFPCVHGLGGKHLQGMKARYCAPLPERVDSGPSCSLRDCSVRLASPPGSRRTSVGLAPHGRPLSSRGSPRRAIKRVVCPASLGFHRRPAVTEQTNNSLHRADRLALSRRPLQQDNGNYIHRRSAFFNTPAPCGLFAPQTQPLQLAARQSDG